MSGASGIVGRDGSVRVLGHLFWSPELACKSGWEVLVEIDHADPCFASVWTKGRTHRLCTAAQIVDPGFCDLEAQRVASRAMREERDQARASVVRGQIEALIKTIDQRVERRLVVKPAFGDGLLAHAFKRLVGFIHNRAPAAAQDNEQRQLEVVSDDLIEALLAEGILETAARVFESRQSFVETVVQSASPAFQARTKPTAADPAAHRLSETSK